MWKTKNRSRRYFAGTTGLEPATSSVTGMRSSQLIYAPICRWLDLNQRLDPYEESTLTTELHRRIYVAGPGVAPGSGAYETPEILLLYPALLKLMIND